MKKKINKKNKIYLRNNMILNKKMFNFKKYSQKIKTINKK